jgi:hypothetical protein
VLPPPTLQDDSRGYYASTDTSPVGGSIAMSNEESRGLWVFKEGLQCIQGLGQLIVKKKLIFPWI